MITKQRCHEPIHADNLLSSLQNRQNHAADLAGGWVGQNPPTGGTIPDNSSTVREAVRAATGQPVTSHNCYGQSPVANCGAFWRDTGGQPNLAPVPAMPTQEMPR